MDLDAFSDWAATVPLRTGLADDPEKLLTYLALGLAGETGESVEHVKKALRGGRPIKTEAFADELGDVLYYWVRLVRAAGLDPDAIMAATQAKIDAKVGTKAR